MRTSVLCIIFIFDLFFLPRYGEQLCIRLCQNIHCYINNKSSAIIIDAINMLQLLQFTRISLVCLYLCLCMMPNLRA